VPKNPRVQLFGAEIDVVNLRQAVETVLAWTRETQPTCRFVVTPNVDHVVLLQEHAGLQAAYHDASLILADGAPVLWAARLLGRNLPERVPGSDLTPAIFAAASPDHPLTTYLLGAGPGVAERAAQAIEARWPAVRVVGTYSPPLGFDKSDGENAAILERIARASPQLLVVGLGAPKQELWVHRFHQRLQARVALCVGASIDFLAGEKPRAPVWMRTTGLEWLHRLCSEPRRLARRYAVDAWRFPQIVARQWIKDRTNKLTSPIS
jgi:N-acetylglucosaminyldiphosphoundecaprenol N-acetyl-beta-D-mannosaminyltransferase